MAKEDKRAQFLEEKKSRLPLIMLVLVVLAAGALGAWLLLPGGDAGAKLLQVENGVVQIPQQELADGNAKFYRVNAGTEINFFLVKSHDGVIRAAFDTCDVCYKEKKGYRQEGQLMVCNNCDQEFRTDLINVVKGGCNPAPLAREVRNGQVVITLAALQQGSWYFN